MDAKLIRDALEHLYDKLPFGADLGRYHDALKEIDRAENLIATTPPKPSVEEVTVEEFAQMIYTGCGELAANHVKYILKSNNLKIVSKKEGTE